MFYAIAIAIGIYVSDVKIADAAGLDPASDKRKSFYDLASLNAYDEYYRRRTTSRSASGSSSSCLSSESSSPSGPSAPSLFIRILHSAVKYIVADRILEDEDKETSAEKAEEVKEEAKGANEATERRILVYMRSLTEKIVDVFVASSRL